MSRESSYVAACFEEIEATGIDYAVLHGARRIPHNVSSDIDIVVRRAGLRHLHEVLQRFAEQHGGVLAQTIRHEATACYYVLALPSESGGPLFVKIDASVDYRAHGRVFFSNRELLEHKRRVGVVWSAAPAEEFGAYLIKRVLKGSLTTSNLDGLREVWSQDEKGCSALCDSCLGPRAARVVGKAMRANVSLADAEAALFAVRRAARWRALWRHPILTLGYWMSEPLRYLARVRHRTGFHVAVLGPDGIGKSSLLDSLTTRIAPAFRRVECVHLKPGLLPARGQASPNPVPYQKPGYGTLLSVAKLAYLALDYNLGYWVRFWPRLVASTLILADRYYLDVVADPRRYRYAGPPGLPRSISRFIPGPDMYLVLTASPDSIQGRKAEVSFSTTQQQAVGYEGLFGLRGVSVVDASGGPQDVSDAASWAILSAMGAQRLGRR